MRSEYSVVEIARSATGSFWLRLKLRKLWLADLLCVWCFSMTERTCYLQGDGGFKYLFSVSLYDLMTNIYTRSKQNSILCSSYTTQYLHTYTCIYIIISRTCTLQYSGSLNQLNTSAFWLLTSANFRSNHISSPSCSRFNEIFTFNQIENDGHLNSWQRGTKLDSHFSYLEGRNN